MATKVFTPIKIFTLFTILFIVSWSVLLGFRFVSESFGCLKETTQLCQLLRVIFQGGFIGLLVHYVSLIQKNSETATHPNNKIAIILSSVFYLFFSYGLLYYFNLLIH